MDNIVNIGDLLPGMVIVKITKQNGPIKIRKSGLVTSIEMVAGLGEMGVQQVEIDPAQTVGIDQPRVQKSQTQKLLESDRLGAHGADVAVSDQFNRSLFLPSVQALPSRWQYYAKPVVLGFVVICVGLVLGWGAAIAPTWLAKFDGPQHKMTASDVQSSKSKSESSVVGASEQAVPAKSVLPVPKDALQQVDAALPSEANSLPVEIEPAKIASTAKDNEATNIKISEPRPQISADLMRRFEKAITELDNEPDKPFTATQTKNEDTPRIDQLPAWVLTRLPPMIFSMHMYASSEQERWVEVSGRRLREGDMIDDKVRIEHIEQQHVILNFQGQTFSMSALSEW